MDGEEQHPRLQRRGGGHTHLLPQPPAAARPGQTGEDGGTHRSQDHMSLLDPILPTLGPLGQILATNNNDTIMVGLVLFGLVCFGIHLVKKNVFETSKSWVGATVILSLITLLFRGLGAVCGCTWFTDPSGNVQQMVPLTYLLISGSFFAILYNFNIPALKKYKWVISVPLSIPLALASDIFLPLVPSRPAWVFLELLFMAP